MFRIPMVVTADGAIASLKRKRFPAILGEFDLERWRFRITQNN
jgi:hypothetical protein